MEKHTSLYGLSRADLSWLCFHEPFIQSGTLRFTRSLGRAHAVRLGDFYNKTLSYQSPYREIRIPSYVDNRRLDEVAERAKNVKTTSKDENGSDSGVEGSSITSSCSIASVFLPPHMSPAWTSESELSSINTLEICGVWVAADIHDDSVINSHEPSDESPTQVQGSRPSPSRLSGMCSAGDNGFKDPQSGGPTSGTYSDPNTLEPPNLVLPRSVGLRSVSITASSHGHSGGEELERTSPGKTRRGPASSPLPGNTNVQPFKREPGSDDATVERMRSDLGWQSSVKQQYPNNPGIPDIKGSEKPGVTKRGWTSKARKLSEKLLTYSKRSSGKRSTIDPVPEGSISDSCWSLTYPGCRGTNVNPGLKKPISRTTSMLQTSHRQIPVRSAPTSPDRRAARLDEGINVIYEMQSPIRQGCRAGSLESISERPIIPKPTLPAADVCTSSKKNKVKKTWSRITNLFKSAKSSY